MQRFGTDVPAHSEVSVRHSGNCRRRGPPLRGRLARVLLSQCAGRLAGWPAVLMRAGHCEPGSVIAGRHGISSGGSPRDALSRWRPATGSARPNCALPSSALALRRRPRCVEAYLLFGRRAGLTANQDTLQPPPKLSLDDSGTTVVFRVENQRCAAWGVAAADLASVDPPCTSGTAAARSRSSSVCRWHAWRWS